MDKAETPHWMQDKQFNEVLFCEDFLAAHPMICVSGSFFTVDGRITDEESIRKQTYKILCSNFNCGLAKCASGLLEMLRLEAYAPDLPIHEDRIHLVTPQRKYCTEAEKQIAKSGCRTRSDSVRVVEALVTASLEFFKGKRRSEVKAYFSEVLDFIKQKQKSETITSAVVHIDGKTPYMHLLRK